MTLNDEHSGCQLKLEEVKREAKVSSYSVEPESRSATGSVRRLEGDYQKQIKAASERNETTLLRLNDEIESLRGQLKEEKMWSRSLEDANNKLEQQLKLIQRL